MKLAMEMRRAGIPVIIGQEGTKLGKQIKLADKAGIQNVIICGSDELEKGIVSIKNLRTGKQRNISIQEYIQEVNII